MVDGDVFVSSVFVNGWTEAKSGAFGGALMSCKASLTLDFFGLDGCGSFRLGVATGAGVSFFSSLDWAVAVKDIISRIIEADDLSIKLKIYNC